MRYVTVFFQPTDNFSLAMHPRRVIILRTLIIFSSERKQTIDPDQERWRSLPGPDRPAVNKQRNSTSCSITAELLQ
jgi:hypothetical protein